MKAYCLTFHGKPVRYYFSTTAAVARYLNERKPVDNMLFSKDMQTRFPITGKVLGDLLNYAHAPSANFLLAEAFMGRQRNVHLSLSIIDIIEQ